MKKSLVLLVIVLIVAGYVYYFEVRPGSRTRSTDELEQASKTVLGLKKEDIKGFTLAKTGADPMTVELVNGEWTLLSPVKSSAEEAAVNSVLWDLEWTEKGLTIPSADVTPEKLKAYGLDTPAGRIDVVASKDNVFHLIVGGASLDGKSVYVRRGNDGPVYLVPKKFAENLDTTVFQMRSKSVVTLTPTQVGYVRLFGRAKVALQKRNNLWNLTEPFEDYADPETVTKLLKDAASLKVISFASDDPVKFPDFGLDAPAGGVTVAEAAATGKTVTVNFGRNAPDEGGRKLVYACLAGGKTAFTVEAETVDKLFPTTPEIQCKTLTRLDPFTLKTAVITCGASEVELSKPDFDWKMVKPYDAEADNAAVTRTLDAFQNARIDQFVTPTPEPGKYGFETPAGSFSYTQADKGTVSIVFGADAGEGLIYAKRSDTPGVLKVSKDVFKELQTPALSYRSLDMQKVAATDVDTLTLTRGEDAYVLKRTSDSMSAVAWRLAKPVDAPANSSMMNALGAALATTRATALVDENASDLARYGLDRPAVRLDFQMSSSAAKKPRSLLVGKPAETGGRYALLEGDRLVFTINPIFARSLMDEPRDTSVFSFNTSSANVIEFTGGDAKVSFSKEGDKWTVTAPAPAAGAPPFDPGGAVSAELAHLAGIRTPKFVSYRTAELAKYGLEKPRAVVRITLPSGAAALSVGAVAESGYYYGTSTTLDGVFLLTPGDVLYVLEPSKLLVSREAAQAAEARGRAAGSETPTQTPGGPPAKPEVAPEAGQSPSPSSASSLESSDSTAVAPPKE